MTAYTTVRGCYTIEKLGQDSATFSRAGWHSAHLPYSKPNLKGRDLVFDLLQNLTRPRADPRLVIAPTNLNQLLKQFF